MKSILIYFDKRQKEPFFFKMHLNFSKKSHLQVEIIFDHSELCFNIANQ